MYLRKVCRACFCDLPDMRMPKGAESARSRRGHSAAKNGGAVSPGTAGTPQTGYGRLQQPLAQSIPGPNAYAQYGAPPQWPKPDARRRSPTKDKNRKDPVGYKAVEMGNPNHPNPHLRMALPESYYARKMEEERTA